MRDKQSTQYGRLYGSGNGAYFGLKDGDNSWSYLAAKDNYTQFRINNASIMTLRSNGSIGIGDTTPDSGLKLDVEGKVGATEYCDQNGANCTAAADLGGGGNFSFNELKASYAGWNSFWTAPYPVTDSVSKTSFDYCFLTTSNVTMKNDNQYNGGGSCTITSSLFLGKWVLTAYADKRMGTICRASCVNF